ncbi:MAG: hypothetical protein IKC72_00265 [Clostridia bacterium]|nr:hypothetical protein [Clostridia bacterium]
MKYPIILVHGIMLKDVWHFKAFGKIGKMLKDQGYHVYTSPHDGLGTIENNAQQIKAFILEIMEKEEVSKVNIIAHSKGGLDSLYMIDRLEMSEHVASVTFLSTPHKGSIIATKLYSMPKIIRNFLAFCLNITYKIAGDKKPDALAVCESLKRSDSNVFECFESHDGIYMQSYSSEMERSRDDFVMGIPFLFSRHFEGEPSDGMVSVESSIYAIYRGNATEHSISHSQIVDFMVNKSKKEKVYGFYMTLCNELEEFGF